MSLFCTCGQCCRRRSSAYMRNSSRSAHARLCVSCFSRFGLALPLNPERQITAASLTSQRHVSLMAVEYNKFNTCTSFLVYAKCKLQTLKNSLCECVSADGHSHHRTCFPEDVALVLVAVEALGEAVRLDETVKQLQQLLRLEELVHALVLQL